MHYFPLYPSHEQFMYPEMMGDISMPPLHGGYQRELVQDESGNTTGRIDYPETLPMNPGNLSIARANQFSDADAFRQTGQMDRLIEAALLPFVTNPTRGTYNFGGKTGEYAIDGMEPQMRERYAEMDPVIASTIKTALASRESERRDATLPYELASVESDIRYKDAMASAMSAKKEGGEAELSSDRRFLQGISRMLLEGAADPEVASGQVRAILSKYPKTHSIWTEFGGLVGQSSDVSSPRGDDLFSGLTASGNLAP